MKKFSSLVALIFAIFNLAAQSSATYTLPYSQDFEGSTFLPTNWQAFGSNSNAAWERNDSVGAYGKSSGSAFFDNFTTNLSGNYYGMRAVSLDLTNAVKPTLKFDLAYAKKNASNSDKLGIWYSYNGTTGWVNLQTIQGTALTTAPDQATYFTPTSGQWDSISIDLSQFAGKSFVRFAFENNCGFGNVLYLDNVRFYDAQFVGIPKEKEVNEKAYLYPNPVTSGQIYVRNGDFEIQEVTIISQTGKVVSKQSVIDENISLSLHNLPTGIYFFRLNFKDETTRVEKLIIQ